MNIDRAIRIAKEQPWWSAYKKNVENVYKDCDRLFDILAKGKRSAEAFINEAFTWRETPEGVDFWTDVEKDFKEKYYDNSVRVFVQKSIDRIPVAKLVDFKRGDLAFIEAMKKAGISYDFISHEGNDLVAYKNNFKIEEEWI